MLKFDLNPIVVKFFHYIDLRPDLEDFEKIKEEIEKGIVFKGTNLWILAFAILVASVGLNMNSTAVIIGAMLISPLMGPINGIGFSIATYNFPMLSRSIKNLSFAIIAGLTASTFYFFVSPVSLAHSELLARTSPTLYDVLIALFGGMAGIVAISTRLKGNVIPGVAIATALMPPLCTAGYGLATLQLNFLFGALYLFTINTVFIALAALLVSKILKFPLFHVAQPSRIKKINRTIYTIIIITLIPSIYFAYNLVEKEKFTQKASVYIDNITYLNGAYLLKHTINADKKLISLVYGGRALTEEEKNELKARTELFGLKANIEIMQGFSIDDSGLKNLSEMALTLENLRTQLNTKQRTIDSLIQKQMLGRDLIDEIKVIFPSIKGIAFSEASLFTDINQRKTLQLVILKTDNKQLPPEEELVLRNYLKKRLNTQNLEIFYLND
ncbi:MAG: DUF389 domain-containing protein [Bacteroidales bacterium]